MEQRASGIIMRTRPLTETSLIVQWLTLEHGRISTVAKGARRPKSPFAGKLDLFYEADFSFARSKKSELHTLRELILRELHPILRQDLARLNAAAYAAVLLEQSTERETPLFEFYNLLKDLLSFLDENRPNLPTVFSFELKFLDLSGLVPSSDEFSPPGATLARTLLESPVKLSTSIQLPKPLAREISTVLRRSIGVSLERLPPQRERLLQSL